MACAARPGGRRARAGAGDAAARRAAAEDQRQKPPVGHGRWHGRLGGCRARGGGAGGGPKPRAVGAPRGVPAQREPHGRAHLQGRAVRRVASRAERQRSARSPPGRLHVGQAGLEAVRRRGRRPSRFEPVAVHDVCHRPARVGVRRPRHACQGGVADGGGQPARQPPVCATCLERGSGATGLERQHSSGSGFSRRHDGGRGIDAGDPALAAGGGGRSHAGAHGAGTGLGAASRADA
mmetsp:Transcript_27073/g.89924  ORF Transcript_27073/g.89924 Transcript_27073/m.89924 type:complete len:236 (-) Transcript_27073:638-1345(-)